ncbi:MAG: PaaI family thioesterase [Acidobacteriota bacterium]
MSHEEHCRKLERLYVAAPCNRYYAPTISIMPGECSLVIPVREDFFHAAHAVHGSVYFKALDDAAFFAANSREERFLVLTVTFQISFLRPIGSGELRAHGQVVHATSRTIFADSVVSDAEGKVIGRGSGCFAVSRIELTPDLGYL